MWRVRLLREYKGLCLNIDRLKRYLDEQPITEKETLEQMQLRVMGEYEEILAARLEKILLKEKGTNPYEESETKRTIEE